MSKLRCYLLDDEELPLLTLERLLSASGRVEIAGSSTDPTKALEDIERLRPDVLFLDIHMPEHDGFAVLSRLSPQPFVVFTTAFEQYALQAFESNSVDYLLKPIEESKLLRALDKLEGRSASAAVHAAVRLEEAISKIHEIVKPASWMTRIACETRQGVSLLDVHTISYFVSEDRHSFACSEAGRFLINRSLSELETRLDPTRFLRIHRSTIVNLRFIDHVGGWIRGQVHLRLRDQARTELTVSRASVEKLRTALGM